MDEKREKNKIATPRARGIGKSRGIDKSAALREGILGLAFGTLAFLLGRCEMLFLTYPLGLALLAVVSRQLPCVFVGVVASAFFEGEIRLIYVAAAFLVVMVRFLCRFLLDKPDDIPDGYLSLSDKIGIVFSENVYLRMMSGAIGAFLVGVYNIVLGGFRFYDLFGAIFYIVITPVAVFLYSEYFIVKEKRAGRVGGDIPLRRDEERLYEVASAALLCSLIYSLSGAVLAGLSLSAFVAFFLTLYYANKGLVRGLILGLLFGLVTGPVYAPLYAFAAIAYVCLKTVSVFGASVAACIVGMIWGLYVGGISALSSLFPALLSSSMVFCTAERIKLFSDVGDFFNNKTGLEQSCALGIVAEDRAKDSIEKMKGISDSFSALSEIFYNLSSKLKRPAMLDLRALCDRTFDDYCPDCDDREICFGAEYATTLEQMKKMTLQLHSAGRVDFSRLNEGFRTRCIYLPDIVDDINKRCGVATQRALRGDKTEVLALDYDAISKILNDAIKENENDYKPDYAMSKRLSAAISEEGFGEHAVMVWGGRKKRILAKGLDLSQNSVGVENLRKKLESVSGFLLDTPEFELSFGSVNMQLSTRRRFAVKSAFATSATLGEGEVCGDTVCVFENKNDFLYAIVSDGMGTGQNAAFTSEMCTVFLQNMLSAGNYMDTSLRMLNSVIRAKSSSSESECSATVDLLQLDLYDGALTLVKSGAAPTFVLRNGNLFKLHAQSFPVGILRSIDAKQIQMNCLSGDLIVMVSDGVARSPEDALWLAEALADEKLASAPLPKLAENIVDLAQKNGSSDDISVVLLKVEDEEES